MSALYLVSNMHIIQILGYIGKALILIYKINDNNIAYIL